MTDTTHNTEGSKERIVSLEHGHIQFQRDLSSLTTDVARVVQAMESTAAALRLVTETQADNARTKWGVVLTGFIVGVMILGLVVYEPMGLMRHSLSKHLDDGHPKSVLDKIQAEKTRLDQQLFTYDREISSLRAIATDLAISQKSTTERLLTLERETYPNASYRSGRPTGQVASKELKTR